jgi:hypothetical protein
MVKGINLKHIKDFPLCDSCILGKYHRTKFPKQAEYRPNSLLNLIHSNIKGPFDPTHTRFKYFITFINDFSRYTTTYLLKLHSEALRKFQEFKAYSENFTKHTIQTLQSDGGGNILLAILMNFML